ncbi:hypothetical protein ACE8EZ_05590 [Pantoea deleyi]
MKGNWLEEAGFYNGYAGYRGR